MKISLQRHVNAPMEVVFDAIAHIENFSQAAPHIVGVEYLSEQKRGVGTRFRETRRMGKREARPFWK
jgi:carbon monoxide dehydrogenase subunit G